MALQERVCHCSGDGRVGALQPPLHHMVGLALQRVAHIPLCHAVAVNRDRLRRAYIGPHQRQLAGIGHLADMTVTSPQAHGVPACIKDACMPTPDAGLEMLPLLD